MRRARFAQPFVAASALSVFVLATLAAPAFAGKADNSLRFTYYATLNSADVYFTDARIALIVADAVWDTRIFRNPKTGEFEGNLATAWRWLDDRTLELELRRGVRFHNGAEFVADDVVYTLDYVRDPKNAAIQRSRVRWIERVEKIDAHTVRIIATQPFPADTSLDLDVRKAAYSQALQLITERVYGVPLYPVPVYYVATEDLVFTPFADEIPRFWEMRWR